tara:strand:- start:3329 stop:3667 length:339 start_codon:yes stop_codon:yes gene_type:complete
MNNGNLIGHCGVDSGQIMLVDPCYVLKDDFTPNTDPTGGAYDEACRITLGIGAGQHSLGVVTSTMWGDGNYPVYADMEGNRVRSVTIVFDDAGLDEDDYCNDCSAEIDYCEC